MIIRQLKPQDAENYLYLRLEALLNNPESFASSYEEEKTRSIEKYKKRFESSGSYTYGAFQNDELIGVVTLVEERSVKLSHRATIVAMYVSSSRRGLGIGKNLMKRAIQKARELERIEQIYLTVVSTNNAARSLYSSLGFEVYGIDKRALKVNGIYFDEELMVLFL
ncbi:GNAT family N-acetyltransferase [Bacillus carboniphilus]|uniref:GNAT family N-acetyltransferase n=2 Tax=Bacillus carboniphilus TaxID=86663 RepID=A0ABY9JY70_9BACI|nr:GNAT family N-acetyltransferase [Bacillus carboniphilus]WLR44361.1 GNAT family N-acetyltransferase [Bacillus carboniphilus]